MTDNPQWQPGQPPPPPSGDAGQQPYADQPGQSAGSTPQGGWQSQPQEGWQGQQSHQSQQAYQNQQAYQPQPAGDERTWMILAHLSAPIAYIFSAGSLSILGPLLIWFLRKDVSAPTRHAAAGAFNFNLTFWLLYIAGWVFGVVTLGLGFLLVIPFWIVIYVVAAYVHIKGALRASRGETYTYPFQLKVLS